MCTANLVFEHVNQNPFHLRPMPDWICGNTLKKLSIYACKKGWQLSLIHGVSEDVLWKCRGRDGWIPLVSFLDKNSTSNPWTHQTFWADILYRSLPTWISHQNISKSSKVTLALYNCEYQGSSRSALKLPHVGISQDSQPLRSYWYSSAS